MIEVELYKLVNSIKNLIEISKLKMSAILAYKLSKIYIKVAKEVEEYEKARNLLVKEYSDNYDDSMTKINQEFLFTFSTENTKKFNEEIIEINNQIIKFDFDKIKIDEKFPETEATNLIALEWLFEI